MKKVLAVFVWLSLSTASFAQDQQLGARTKAMGGSYTAFEEDPVSIWLNPAGISTQTLQATIAYQTYTIYPVEQSQDSSFALTSDTGAETGLVDPAFIPSYLGIVIPVGDPEDSWAIGVCFARPFVLSYALDKVSDPAQAVFKPESNLEQVFMRFRVAGAKDFRFRELGKPGWFPHLSVGLGLDVGFQTWEFSESTGDQTDQGTAVGFGVGLLVGIYDNVESLKVNFGFAYQSGMTYDFNIDPELLPAFDMPQQVNVGVTFYLLQDMPLRLTLDVQWVDWSGTAPPSRFSGKEEIEDALNFSLGGEYRIILSESVSIFPRMGYRLFDAPWDDKDDLPFLGRYKMVLDSDGDRFHIVTFGVGLTIATEEGKVRSIDIAGDLGGDTINIAVGYTHEF